jgi:hypothetical protein
MHIKALSAVLLLTAMLALPATQAADDTDTVKAAAGAQGPCAVGTAGCQRGASAEHREIALHPGSQDDCAKDAQDCDPRGRGRRDRSSAEGRDRHAGRD